MKKPGPRTRIACAVAVVLAATALPAPAVAAAPDSRHVEGSLPSGATYVMDVPTAWNGTVLLFSHGYNDVGAPNPAEDAPDDATKSLLLKQGYALAGSSYASAGWALPGAVDDQLATLSAFIDRFGSAGRTVAWGRSYGGMVTTAIAERHPERIDGSLSLCGLVHGGVANWNNTLDPVFALKTLLTPGSDVPLVDLPDQETATRAADTMVAAVDKAQTSPKDAPASRSPPPCTTSPAGTRRRSPGPAPPTGTPNRPTSTTPSRACSRSPPSTGARSPRPGPAATRPGTPASTTRSCSRSPP